jgi:hypothetical protein
LPTIAKSTGTNVLKAAAENTKLMVPKQRTHYSLYEEGAYPEIISRIQKLESSFEWRVLQHCLGEDV